jgi:Na+-transporting NADH:ubiquinone oxidoreductase subunit NqrD
VLALVALFREFVGAGAILGHTVLSPVIYERNVLFLLAPGAFFTVGLLIWIANAMKMREAKEAAK